MRTREPAELAQCEVVVDVGGVYDPNQQRYDHHQRWACFHMIYKCSLLFV